MFTNILLCIISSAVGKIALCRFSAGHGRFILVWSGNATGSVPTPTIVGARSDPAVHRKICNIVVSQIANNTLSEYTKIEEIGFI